MSKMYGVKIAIKGSVYNSEIRVMARTMDEAKKLVTAQYSGANPNNFKILRGPYEIK